MHTYSIQQLRSHVNSLDGPINLKDQLGGVQRQINVNGARKAETAVDSIVNPQLICCVTVPSLEVPRRRSVPTGIGKLSYAAILVVVFFHDANLTEFFRIQYLDGTCRWEDMANSFSITRNSLSIDTPIKSNGDIDCVDPATGDRKFPKLDYSKGFPDWWYLSRTDITVPSEHYQHGQRYAAEVKLNHFYEIDHYKNKLGIISFFMQDFDNEPSWPYLDKLICKWREEEEKRRSACGMDPAPVYKMCELYRGQTRTAADMEAPTAAVIVPTRAPLVAPPAVPVQNFGGDPEEFRLPLGLCQGDCDFTGTFVHSCFPCYLSSAEILTCILILPSR